jgi:hypothetical protein
VQQLCLAFSALLRCAVSTSAAASASAAETPARYALAQFCLDALITALLDTSSDAGQKHRLDLALISSVSSLPLALLPGALDKIQHVITNTRGDGARREMVDALFREMMERVGDKEKSFVVQWWGENSSKFEGRWKRSTSEAST